MMLEVNVVKVNCHSRAAWNRDHIMAVHIIRVVAWISRTCQCIVRYGTALCEIKYIILISGSLKFQQVPY